MTDFTAHIELPRNARAGDVYTWTDILSGETRNARLERKFRRVDMLQDNADGSKCEHVAEWVKLIDMETGEVYERMVLEPVPIYLNRDAAIDV